MAKLTDSLTPLNVDVVKQVIISELNKPVEEMFSSFNPIPVGVASIGQAHAATLKDGTEVIVKVRKPGVVEQVQGDLEILHNLAAPAGRNWKGAEFYDLVGIEEELAETLMAEMDYIREGKNADHFARFFRDDPTIHIPKIYWDYTTTRVITLERIRGIGIFDIAALTKAGFDCTELARRTANIWLKMVFEGEVFHADPHPGNLFVEPDGRLGLIDFGMTGFISEEVRDHLANAVKGILDRNADLLVDSLVDLGAVPHVSREILRKDIQHVLSHFPVTAVELSSSANLGELLDIVRRNGVQLPGNTFLLLKTMAMAQGLTRNLDPKLDYLKTVEPYVTATIDKRYSAGALVRKVPSAISELAIWGADIPKRLNRILRSVELGELSFRADMPDMEGHLEHLEKIVNRLLIGFIIATVIIGAAVGVAVYALFTR